LGKKVDDHFVIKALQLYIEGLSYREIERLLGVSHVSVMNWVKQHRIKRPSYREYHPSYRIVTHNELIKHMNERDNLSGMGMIITEIGDKFMLIKWERFIK
jgi:transposase